jgi:2-hydroxyacyl-CoA lyase 1
MTDAIARELNGGQLIAAQLAAEGIDTVFGVVAGPMLEAFAAFPRYGIRVIGCRHEEQAGFMAQAWGYITKKAGVVVVGSGPGMINTITSLHVAQANGWPLVVLGGSVHGSRRGLGGFQEAPQVALAAPACKWAIEVDSTARIPEYVHLGLGKALSGRPGAVYIDFPGELLSKRVPEQRARLRPRQSQPYRPHPDPAAIEAIAQMLASAQRPLVLVGKGAAWADASEPLQRLVDHGIPFVASPMGRGTIPDDHPLCVGSARSSALNHADAVLMLGGRFNWMFLPYGPARGTNRGGLRRPDLRIAHIDILEEELYSAVSVDIGVVADCSVAANALCDAIAGHSVRSATSEWVTNLRQESLKNQATVAEQMLSDATPINHYRLWRDVRDSLDRTATVIVDGEITLGVGRIVMPSYLPRHRLNSGTTGCMGTGVPYAIAAKLARPDQQVVAVLGDYAFGTGYTEIETAARVGAHVVFVVDNNSGIAGHHLQDSLFLPEDERIAALLPVHYEKMAEMVGGYSEYVEQPAQIRPALERALAAESVAIINVMTDPRGEVRPGASYLMG